MAILNLSGKDIVIKSLPVPEFSSYLQKKIQESEALYPDLPARLSVLSDDKRSWYLASSISQTAQDKDFHLYVRMVLLLNCIQNHKEVLMIDTKAVMYHSLADYLLHADLAEGVSLR